MCFLVPVFVFSDPDDGDGLMRVTVCVDWSVPVCSDHSHNNHTPDRGKWVILSGGKSSG